MELPAGGATVEMMMRATELIVMVRPAASICIITMAPSNAPSTWIAGAIDDPNNLLFHGHDRACDSFEGGGLERYCSRWGGHSFNYRVRCKIRVEANWEGRSHCIGGSDTNRYRYSDLAFSNGASCRSRAPNPPGCQDPKWRRHPQNRWTGTCCNSCSALLNRTDSFSCANGFYGPPGECIWSDFGT